jgi:hypothetical protein
MTRVIKFDEERANRSLLKYIAPGDRLRLRDDFLRHVHPREWIFQRIESDGTILLVQLNLNHDMSGITFSSDSLKSLHQRFLRR